MKAPDFAERVGPELAAALQARGFTSLTPVQEAVLDPALAGRDLRITSQTGSGKTVAIGFILRELVTTPADSLGFRRPAALVIAPTRELAKQVEEELAWLLSPLRAKVVSVTGGANYTGERRALSTGPAVVVGTPGRILDHLRRGSLDPAGLGAVVLDEADRMLDLGFREDLEAILALAPANRRTHLVSATFPREVRTLADHVQQSPAIVEGTPLGSANLDIDHVIHLVDPKERVSAIVNLLLSAPGAQTLIFARTRADVASIAAELSRAGFRVAALSGEMEQPERNRALASFKRGDLHALVATDVAARGIDVQEITRVVHVEAPTTADAYTHRSGRTGRAGRKGTSAILAAPGELKKVASLLGRAGVRHKLEPLPTAASIRAADDERLFRELTEEPADGAVPDQRYLALARRVVEAGDPTRSLARLLAALRRAGPAEPRELRVVTQRSAPAHGARAVEHPHRAHQAPGHGARAGAETGRPRGAGERVRPETGRPRGAAPGAGQRPTLGRGPEERGGGQPVPFRVSWGEERGADPRRLLAMVCRRGGIRGSDVGAIRVEPTYSIVEIAPAAAKAFALAAGQPDHTDPRVSIRRMDTASLPRGKPGARPPPRGKRQP